MNTLYLRIADINIKLDTNYPPFYGFLKRDLPACLQPGVAGRPACASEKSGPAGISISCVWTPTTDISAKPPANATVFSHNIWQDAGELKMRLKKAACPILLEAAWESEEHLRLEYSMGYKPLREWFRRKIEKKSRILDFTQLYYLVLNHPLLYYAQMTRGWTVVHASCVERDGNGLLIIGPSDTGKTTLSLKLLERGWSLLSDDMIFVDGDAAKAIYEPVRINTASRRWLSKKAWRVLHAINSSRDACEPEGRRAFSARPRAAIFPEWSDAAELIPIRPDEAAQRALDVAAMNESLREYAGFAASLGFQRPLMGQRQRDLEHVSRIFEKAKAFRLCIRRGEPLDMAVGLIEKAAR